MEDGSFAKDDADNMIVMYPHFQKVFNNNRDVDHSVLTSSSNTEPYGNSTIRYHGKNLTEQSTN
ncbi:hypothetical protein ACHAWF_012941 [Thalassiosira exigua]